MTRITTRGEEEEIIIPIPPKKLFGVPLVADSKQWRRWWSLRWMALSLALQSVSELLSAATVQARDGWVLLPSAWVASLPAYLPQVLGLSAIAALVLAGLARCIQQRAKA